MIKLGLSIDDDDEGLGLVDEYVKKKLEELNAGFPPHGQDPFSSHMSDSVCLTTSEFG